MHQGTPKRANTGEKDERDANLAGEVALQPTKFADE
jgi:hypothetical protein